MTIKERIISFLQNHTEGVDDDELAKALNLSARQQANLRCRRLEGEGLVIRQQVNGKIRNFWAANVVPVPTAPLPPDAKILPTGIPKSRDWFWEGSVQSTVVSFLAAHGYTIRSQADTASHQRGIDIEAEKDGKSLWVSVKGYPKGTEKTKPSVQAGHWFKQVIFDMIEYRERRKDVLLAVALPDFPRYRTLAQKITWFKPVAKFAYFWVKADGVVDVE
jgi:hypothetical protein